MSTHDANEFDMKRRFKLWESSTTERSNFHYTINLKSIELIRPYGLKICGPRSRILITSNNLRPIIFRKLIISPYYASNQTIMYFCSLSRNKAGLNKSFHSKFVRQRIHWWAFFNKLPNNPGWRFKQKWTRLSQ